MEKKSEILKQQEQEQKQDDAAQDDADINANQEESDKEDSKKDKMIKIKESEYQKLQQEVDEYKDKYFRLYAEFENARKRMERDKIEFVKYANEGILADFLEVVDNLERSINVAKSKHEDYNAFLKGIDMIWKQIEEFLRKNNVQAIEAKGKKFDHNCHEVLMQEENDDMEEDTVVEEFQKGYTLNNRVLRTAKVKLSKKKEPVQESKPETEKTEVQEEEKQENSNQEG